MRKGSPTSYRTMQEFEREELTPFKKAGWSLDDLFSEAKFNPGEDSSLEDSGPKELDFDY